MFLGWAWRGEGGKRPGPRASEFGLLVDDGTTQLLTIEPIDRDAR